MNNARLSREGQLPSVLRCLVENLGRERGVPGSVWRTPCKYYEAARRLGPAHADHVALRLIAALQTSDRSLRAKIYSEINTYLKLNSPPA